MSGHGRIERPSRRGRSDHAGVRAVSKAARTCRRGSRALGRPAHLPPLVAAELTRVIAAS